MENQFTVPLTHSFPVHPFSTPLKHLPENIYTLMFSGGRERVHWKQTINNLRNNFGQSFSYVTAVQLILHKL